VIEYNECTHLKQAVRTHPTSSALHCIQSAGREANDALSGLHCKVKDSSALTIEHRVPLFVRIHVHAISLISSTLLSSLLPSSHLCITPLSPYTGAQNPHVRSHHPHCLQSGYVGGTGYQTNTGSWSSSENQVSSREGDIREISKRERRVKTLQRK
jgi:hypothetical protein